MKPFLFAFSFVLCATMFSAFTPAAQNYTTDNNAAQAQNNNDIEWVELDALDSLMQKEPRKVLFKIYADWCGWCKKLDKNTFQHPDIVEYVNENFYAVKLDAEMRTPVTVSGREYKYITDGKRGTHELALALTNGQMSLPTMVVLSSKMAQMGIIPGYQEPTDMDAILHYFATGSYEKNIPWGVFQKNYRSRIKSK